MDDMQITELLWQRDERGLRACEEKYGKLCMAQARRILSSDEDAEECVNEAWLRLWNAVPPERPTHLRAFILRITRNLSLDRYRAVNAVKRSHGYQLCLEELEAFTDVGEEDDGNLSALLNGYLDGLGTADRRLFVGRYWHGYTLEQLSTGYGIPVSTVRYRLEKLRENLKEYLQKEGYMI